MKQRTFSHKSGAVLTLVLVLFFCSTLQAQTYTNINTYGYKWLRGAFGTTLIIPKGPTPVFNSVGDSTGALFYNTTDSSIYVHTGTQWIQLSGGGGGSSYSAGYGLALSSNTFRVDTNVISTKWYRQKGIDSITALLAANYYTQSATNTLLSGKANTSHSHIAADISDFTPAGRALISAGAGLSYNNATGVMTWTGSASGITDLNGLTGTTQTFATGTSGTDFNIASAGTQHTFNIPTVSGSNRGLVTSSLFNTWNGKQAALSGTGFVKISGTTISYDNSTYLTSETDPLAALKANNLSDLANAGTARTNLGFTTGYGLTGFYAVDTTLIASRLRLKNTIDSLAATMSGYVPTSRTLTINGTTYDLSANRSWTVTSDNIYNADDTLTGNRIVDGGTHNLLFQNIGTFNILNTTNGLNLYNVTSGVTNSLQLGSGISGDVSVLTSSNSLTDHTIHLYPDSAIIKSGNTDSLDLRFKRLHQLSTAYTFYYNPTTGETTYSTALGGGGSTGSATDRITYVSTDNYTVLSTDTTIVYEGFAGTITLPTASLYPGRRITIVMHSVSQGSATISPAFVYNSSGSTASTIPGNSTQNFISDGTNWKIANIYGSVLPVDASGSGHSIFQSYNISPSTGQRTINFRPIVAGTGVDITETGSGTELTLGIASSFRTKWDSAIVKIRPYIVSGDTVGEIREHANRLIPNDTLAFEAGEPGPIDFQNEKGINLADPEDATDAANKGYVDLIAAGAQYKDSVRAATITAGTLASSFENGDVIDGITLATGNRILIKNQAAPAENGIYIVPASGAPTRATDYDAGPEAAAGTTTFVTSGTTNAGTQWTQSTSGAIALGTTALVFVQIGNTSVADGSITNAKLAGYIDAAKINTGVVSNAEFNRLDGVTGDIQTQIDSKLGTSTASSTYAPLASPTFTGTVTIPSGSVLGTPTSINLANATFPTLNQNTTGTSSNLSGTPALPNGTTATTQSASDNSTKLATTAYADAKVADAINDAVTTIAPSQNAVFDALALKAPVASPTFTGTVTIPNGGVLGTPTSINLANATFPTLNQNTTGTAGKFTGMTLAEVNTAVTDADLARTDAANTFTGVQTMTSPSLTTPDITTGFKIGGAAASGKIIIGNGTNYVASTPTYPNAAGTANNVITSDGTNFVSSANTGGWTTLRVSGSNATTTGQTLIDITGLVSGTLTNATLYEVEAVLYVTTSAVTTGTQYAVAAGGSGGASEVFMNVSGTTTTNAATTVTQSASGTAAGTFLTTSGASGIVTFKGFVLTRGSGTATISLQHLKVTSGTSTVKIGSVLRYRLAQ